MITDLETQQSEILVSIARELDIPESQHEQAIERYKAIGDWLGEIRSFLSKHRPQVYSQGSFRLGTVVKPVKDGDEYDIDLVCELDISKDEITQHELKHMVGKRLRENTTYSRMLEEKTRCWRVNYANEFHLDILPAIGVDFVIDGGILVPDKTLGLWHPSNPEGYADWFKNEMLVAYMREQDIMAYYAGAEVKEVPNWKIKTPLQRVIQILKRHRDIMFDADDENKPISIIITTLAARAYENESDVFVALKNILHKMPDFIIMRNGRYYVLNPVNHDENFADKWNMFPERARMFKDWLNAARLQFKTLSKQRGLHKLGESLKPLLGDAPVNSALRTYGVKVRDKRQAGTLRMDPKTGILGTTGLVVKDHTFYGR